MKLQDLKKLFVANQKGCQDNTAKQNPFSWAEGYWEGSADAWSRALELLQSLDAEQPVEKR